MLEWKEKNYQVLKGNYRAYEEEEKELSRCSLDKWCRKETRRNSFIFLFYRCIFEVWVRKVAAITDSRGINLIIKKKARKFAFHIVGTLS